MVVEAVVAMTTAALAAAAAPLMLTVVDTVVTVNLEAEATITVVPPATNVAATMPATGSMRYATLRTQPTSAIKMAFC
jgi:hypothetical protein